MAPPSAAYGSLPTLESVKKFKELTSPHVESFNYLIEEGLPNAIENIDPVEFELSEGSGYTIRMWLEDPTIGLPMKSDETTVSAPLLPREARERGIMYSAPVTIRFCYQIHEGNPVHLQKRLGDLPIMVISKRCHLHSFSPLEMIKHYEEAREVGGYFIVNGIERVIRLLQVPKRNYVLALNRSSFKNRGPQYSEQGVTMRCVRNDQTSITNTLHYLTTGTCTLRFAIRKEEYLIPVVLIIKALRDISDREIYERILRGDHENTFLSARLELLLQDSKQYGVYSQVECLAFLGTKFRSIFYGMKKTDAEIGRLVLQKYVFVHLDCFTDKLETLFHMIRKLYVFVQGKCVADNPDSPSNLEVLLPGHLITMMLKERVEDALEIIKRSIMKDASADITKTIANTQNAKYMSTIIDRFIGSIANKVASFLATGNIVSSTGLDLMQVSGYTIVGERLNAFRFISHFRSVHRGQFFAQMKTTAVRKLLPESWGFLCPAHTPDGAPCGLLNHLTAVCKVLCYPPKPPASVTTPLAQILVSLGVTPSSLGGGDGNIILPHTFLPVLIDGKVIGGAPSVILQEVAAQLRIMKTQQSPQIEPTLEVAFIPHNELNYGPYPGLYLFTTPARLVRPVLQLKTKRVELIGTLEQVFMEIACVPNDIYEQTTHQELDPTNMLSLVASLTPFSDYNQGPRIMYQCQMGKQTMGTPCHAFPTRADNKMYRILFPQAPLVQTRRHAEYQMDEYPHGANAVVAVISYTGYDMEDAMIINKGSYDRGFGYGAVYKTLQIDLNERERGGNQPMVFNNWKSRNPMVPNSEEGQYCESLDIDGLPRVGSWVAEGDPIYCTLDRLTQRHLVTRHKESEKACIENVRALGKQGSDGNFSKASITLRFPRKPVIGDKFSSRHGQKGVMSILWPQQDMPFTESGMTPDVIINPHAFPSRMTIGMLIESMAGKSGALHGFFQDATPFQFHEKNRAIDYFGEQLRAAGYHYYGSEPLYSGISGTIMHADIFIGVVYYQRLRHMVADKAQVRATGPVNQLTRQPVKGRKRHGGIRFGEMERDSFISHGVSFLLHDRLMNSSDRHIAHICSACGSLLSPTNQRTTILSAGQTLQATATSTKSKLQCRTCHSTSSCETVALPYVYRYLANELAGMNIKLTMKLS